MRLRQPVDRSAPIATAILQVTLRLFGKPIPDTRYFSHTLKFPWCVSIFSHGILTLGVADIYCRQIEILGL